MNKIADYQLVELLDDFGFGRLWLADPPERIGHDGLVHLKVLEGGANGDAYKRFVNELRVYVAADGSHLVAIIDAGHAGDKLFYATPNFGLGTLNDSRANRTGKIRYVADSAEGAHALHEAGVAHRNIRPEAIHITPHGAVLGDLGVAEILHPTQTITGYGPIGTVDYIAPEVILGERASRASDIWSLASVLHRSVTGHPVHPELPTTGLADALRHIIENEPRLHPGLSSDEHELLTDCLDMSPAARPGTASELADRLRTIAGERHD